MKKIFIILMSVVLFQSCTKKIDVKLNSAARKHVIEGRLTTEAGGCKVLVSATKDFNSDNNFPGISGAIVTIRDNDGNISMLYETGAGVYTNSALIGESGKTYQLKVEIGDTVYTASSTLPEFVPLKNVWVTNEAWAGETWKLANIEYQDKAGTENYYFFTLYINGAKRQELYFIDDEFADGNLQELKMYMFTDTEDEDRIKTGDVVAVDMMCIDKHVYKYWYSAAQSVTSHSQSGAPSNPVSNISGGALGYFSAQTIDRKSVVAQ